jgi:hypothetical protein
MAKGIVGIYSYVDDLKKGVMRLKELKVKQLEVYTPTYLHEITELLKTEPSPVRYITFFGALTGFLSAIAMTWYMSVDWPLRPSMKPVLSWPAYTVIMFELTVLLGGLFNLLALFLFCGLLKPRYPKGFDPRFTDDRMGIEVYDDPQTLTKVEAILKETGAEEVRYVE